jgi:tetratricopeptide (TPR) repeat protein
VLALWVLVGVLAQSGQPHAAYGAARPSECGGADGLRARSLWERAKEPELRKYCDLLARGTGHLVGSASLLSEVITIADEADKVLPGRAAPSVLRGRALLRLGRPAEAVAALKEAKARDDRALDDAVALLAWARANARTGNRDDAAAAYRAALPRIASLSSAERGGASLEAGLIVMAQGPKAIDDAVAMLRQARRDAQDALQVVAVVGLALALDRAGQRDEAKAMLAERALGDSRSVFSDPHVVSALGDAGVAEEADALAATALEAFDASLARDAWKRYLAGAGGKGPWADHARQHESGSSGGGSSKRARTP